MNPPVLRPAAAADVEEAWRWYEARRDGLGDDFLVECLLAGDLDTGKAILRDSINATIGFEKLRRLTGRPEHS